MTSVENVELRASLCTICDWRPSSLEDQSPSNINNLEKRKVSLLAKALKEKLPKDFKHLICKPQPNEYVEPDVCVLRIDCKTQVDVDTWVSNYSELSGFQWDRQSIVSFNRKVKELYRCRYVCHDPAFEKSLCDNQLEASKCPASITVVIKSGKNGVYDEHNNTFPTIVQLRGNHSCFFGRTIKGDIVCSSLLQYQESEIISSDSLLFQAITQTKENTTEAKKITAKKDLLVPDIITPISQSKQNTLKREPTVSNEMDIVVTTIVDSVKQDGKININDSLHKSKENTTLGILKGTTIGKEKLQKVDINKAKIAHGKPSNPNVKTVTKMPLILVKKNSIIAPTNTDVSASEGRTERNYVAKFEKPADTKAAVTTKTPNAKQQSATKRKREKINGHLTKNKKLCITNVNRIEGSKKTSPKKTPEVQKTDCAQQIVNNLNGLETDLQLPPKSPPKAVTTFEVQPVIETDKFESLAIKFNTLFAQNHEPATALASHIVDLQLNYGSNWRNVPCPDLAWCQRRFDKVFSEPRITTPQTTLTALAKFSEQYEDLCTVESVPNGGFAGLVVTELMRCNLETNPNAAGINYVLPYLGSTSQLFLVMCDSEGGGLPLAIIITSDTTPTVLASAVRLLAKRARLSPRLWLVPDMVELFNAFVAVFPGASVNLSLTQLLKDSWQFALRQSSRVPDSHQVLLYQFVVHMISCPSEFGLLYQLQVALADPAKGLETFCKYLSQIYARRNEWAVYLRDPAFREGALETEIGITKSSVFSQLHDFDTVHLVHFAVTRLDLWYKNRSRAIELRMHVDEPITTAAMPADVKLTTLSDGVFLVQFGSESEEHLVNDIVGICSCLKGNAGWCRHQLAVVLRAKSPSPAEVLSLVPADPVQVDTSMPEIFPASIMGEPRESGSRAGSDPKPVEGKRIRKPKLVVDLGAFQPPKKHKKKGEEEIPPSKNEVEHRSAVNCVNNQVVKMGRPKGRPKPKQSLGDSDHTVRKVQTVKKTAPKGDTSKRSSLPCDFSMENVRKFIAASGVPSARRHSSDSGGSQKAVHFSSIVQEKTKSSLPSAEHKAVLQRIKVIKRNLTMCYTFNPNLKDKIYELYNAMKTPAFKPQSILKQSCAASTAVPRVEDLPVEVNLDVKVEQCVKVEVVSCSDAPADDLSKLDAVKEPAIDGVSCGMCFVSLNAFDVEKYKKPDGSYSLVT